VKFVKREDVVIEAMQMRHDGMLFDRGRDAQPVPFEAGDYIVTGVLGEQYRVKRAVFEATYRPIEEPSK
jgi:hypothetical protein